MQTHDDGKNNKQGKTTMKKATNEKGFSLVELAIVLIIFGLVISTVMFTFKFSTRLGSRETTIERIGKSQSAAYLSQVIYGFYPCPADPTLAPGDAQYGRPDCGAAVRLIGRDVDNADGDNNPLTGGDIALMGALPLNYFLDPNGDGDQRDAVLGVGHDRFTAKDGFDKWNNKLTYIVTETMTTAATFDQNEGVIDVVDEGVHADPDPLEHRRKATLLEQWGSAHFVILSHGPNGVGAYTRNGNLIQNCNLGLTTQEEDDKAAGPLATAPDETENCENTDGDDATFLSGLLTEGRSHHNDDILKFTISTRTDLWEITDAEPKDNGTPNDPSDDYYQYKVSNTNSGHVGIGLENPTEKVDIDGDIQAYEIHAEKLCDSSGGDCMVPAAIGGELPDMQCPKGQVIVKIHNNSVDCASPFTAGSFGACAPNEFITSITSTGFTCTPLP